MPTTRDLMMTSLHARIAWFRKAARPLPTMPTRDHLLPTRRSLCRHTMAYLRLSNRDEDEVILRPVMWILFDL